MSYKEFKKRIESMVTYKCGHCGKSFPRSKMAGGLEICQRCAAEIPA